MPYTRLTDCVECSKVSTLLSDIDCKLFSLSKALYNNIIFSLNIPISGLLMEDLITYKRILTYKLFNPDYMSNWTVSRIASRIKILIHK